MPHFVPAPDPSNWPSHTSEGATWWPGPRPRWEITMDGDFDIDSLRLILAFMESLPANPE